MSLGDINLISLAVNHVNICFFIKHWTYIFIIMLTIYFIKCSYIIYDKNCPYHSVEFNQWRLLQISKPKVTKELRLVCLCYVIPVIVLYDCSRSWKAFEACTGNGMRMQHRIWCKKNSVLWRRINVNVIWTLNKRLMSYKVGIILSCRWFYQYTEKEISMIFTSKTNISWIHFVYIIV